MFAAPASDQALQRWQPSSMCRDVAPSCPRCASPNTKFCYYNNYSLSQPRYFCKGCRRYWTRGGSLRNVPVGGGSRKNRRGKPSSSSSSTTTVRAAPAELAPSAHPHNSSTTQDCNVDAASQSSAAEIDLAAVYAKFLNSSSDYDRKSSSGSHSQEQENSSFSAADSVTPESRQTTSLEIIGDQGETLIGVPRIEETVEGMLMDNTFVHEAVQDPDGLLLGDATSSFANFPWQPMVHLQEIETFQSDDQFKLLSAYDSWSLFDLSGFEVFTRP